MNATRPSTSSTPGQALEIMRDALSDAGSQLRPRGPHAFMASCPLHSDVNPSLSVTWRLSTRDQSAGGVVLLHCFSCNGDPANITAALGLRLSDLFDNPHAPTTGRVRMIRQPIKRTPPPPAAPVEHQWTRVRVYTYTDSGGMAVQQVIREECCCGGNTHKRFVQRYREGRRWKYRKPTDFVPVLYRLRDLRQAQTKDQWVWLVEGEKDADTAARLGQIATTNAQGASSFPIELLAELTGRRVAIVADRDAAGYQRALTLFDQLRETAVQRQILLPVPAEPKSDLTDHVDAGHWDHLDSFGGLIATTPAELADLLRQSATPADSSPTGNT